MFAIKNGAKVIYIFESPINFRDFFSVFKPNRSILTINCQNLTFIKSIQSFFSPPSYLTSTFATDPPARTTYVPGATVSVTSPFEEATRTPSIV